MIFNTENIGAILDDRKNQTRRVITPQPEPAVDWLEWRNGQWQGYMEPGEPTVWKWKCPYGVPGDKLWVKETFWHYGGWEQYIDDKNKSRKRFIPFGDEDIYHVYYQAHPHKPSVQFDLTGKANWYKKPSIFMPQAFSRILLEIKNIRVEKIKSISSTDATAEGINIDTENFFEFWDSINLNRGYGWDTNPDVWVIEFEVMEQVIRLADYFERLEK